MSNEQSIWVVNVIPLEQRADCGFVRLFDSYEAVLKFLPWGGVFVSTEVGDPQRVRVRSVTGVWEYRIYKQAVFNEARAEHEQMDTSDEPLREGDLTL